MFSGPAYVNDCSQRQLFPFSMNCITPCFGIITGVISSAQSDPSAQTPLSYLDFFFHSSFKSQLNIASQ